MSKHDPTNDISLHDMYEGANWDVNTHNVTVDGKDCVVIGTGFNNTAYAIEKYVKEILVSDLPAFTLDLTNPNKPSVTVHSLGKRLPYVNGYINAEQPGYTYSEYVQVFFAKAKSMGLDSVPLSANPTSFNPIRQQYAAHTLNQLIHLIRLSCKTPEFKKNVNARVYNATRNHADCKLYVDRLFGKCSRLLVMRIDLSYLEKYAASIDIPTAQKHLKHFLNNTRHNSLFAPLEGYIWRRECGESKGIHFHLVLFFDGAQALKDEFIATKIGKYWETVVTKGQGMFFNCNQNKRNRYQRLGIGMIHHSDTEMRANLMLAISYLTKKELIFGQEKVGGYRAFGKGNKPPERTNNVGRPRTRGNPGAK